MPRFVILEHDHPTLHWDLMLEVAGVLKTWRLPASPTEQPTQATAIGDHRLAYLDYEGPVSGNRGTVRRWDTGSYEAWQMSDAICKLRLQGLRWQGLATLAVHQEQHWTIQFVESAAARPHG